jgi:hypothetical protein
MSNYSPQMTEKMDSKWLSLATTAMDGGSAGFAGAQTSPFQLKIISIIRQD